MVPAKTNLEPFEASAHLGVWLLHKCSQNLFNLMIGGGGGGYHQRTGALSLVVVFYSPSSHMISPWLPLCCVMLLAPASEGL